MVREAKTTLCRTRLLFSETESVFSVIETNFFIYRDMLDEVRTTSLQGGNGLVRSFQIAPSLCSLARKCREKFPAAAHYRYN
jgi:hypothetical protein